MHKFLAFVVYLIVLMVHADRSSAASLASGNLEVKRRSERVKAATELLADFDKLATLVQTPRPSEETWVKAEQADIAKIVDSEVNTARSIQLLQTPEFQQRNVYTYTQEVRNALRCVIDSPPTVHREVFCWAAASFLLNERSVFYDGLSILVRARRLPEDLPARVGSASFDGISLLYGFHSRAIQQYVVLPYLRGDFK